MPIALTAAEYQALLVAMFGNQTVTDNILTYWQAAGQPYSDDDPGLIYLATRLYVLDLALAGAIGKVDFRALNGASVSQSQEFDHLMALHKLWSDELAAGVQSSAGARVSQIAKTAPIEPPYTTMPDANDRAYRGDPYRGGRRTRWPR